MLIQSNQAAGCRIITSGLAGVVCQHSRMAGCFIKPGMTILRFPKVAGDAALYFVIALWHLVAAFLLAAFLLYTTLFASITLLDAACGRCQFCIGLARQQIARLCYN